MNSKSFKLFSSFSPADRELLAKFIEFEANTRTIELIKLKNIYENALNLNVTKREIFQKIFPRSKFSDSKLRLLQSDFTKVMERCIAYKNLTDQTPFYKKSLLSYTKTKGLNNMHQKYLRKFTTTKEATHQSWEDNLFLAEELYENAIRNRETAKEVTQSLLNTLDNQYILKKLRYSCLVRSQENVYNYEFDHGIRNEVLAFVQDKNLLSQPLIGTYYYCFGMLEAKSRNDDFDAFFHHLQSYGNQFPLEIQSELYTLAINFCIRSLNQGNKAFGKMGLLFYTDGLDKGILLKNNKITRFTFRNIITMAIRTGEFEQAENFIAKYQHLLVKEDQQNMVYFTTSLVLFSKGKYEEASQQLLNVKFKDLLFNLAAKGLQLKIYYETEEFWVLSSHLDAMQIFLKRQQSLGYHKQNYLNLIAYTRKLMNAKTTDKIKKLYHKIRDEKTLTERIWFQEKVNELLVRQKISI